MNIQQSLLEALDSLRSNKMRSGLTILGIVIGVAAVIAMLAIGTGAEESITGQIESAGSNLLYVSSGGVATNPETLTLDDAEAISDQNRAPSIGAVAPVNSIRVDVSLSGDSTNTSIEGITPDFFCVQYSSSRRNPVY
jgi:putative ABC transport system permease protein